MFFTLYVCQFIQFSHLITKCALFISIKKRKHRTDVRLPKPMGLVNGRTRFQARQPGSGVTFVPRLLFWEQ